MAQSPRWAAGQGGRGMSSSMLPLRARNLRYVVEGKTLIDDISLSIHPGTFNVVLGPNGAGKSLLLRLLHGLLDPTSGTVDWMNSGNGDLRRRQAMVFQRPVLLRRSVEANVAFALKSLSIPRAEHARLIDEALDRSGLTASRRVPARLLSVGEQQRLAVARALAGGPDVIFLDEPTASLDPASVQRIEGLLLKANRNGTAIVLVTHDIGQARRLARKILFLHRGRLIERRPAEEFFNRQDADVARAYLEGNIVV